MSDETSTKTDELMEADPLPPAPPAPRAQSDAMERAMACPASSKRDAVLANLEAGVYDDGRGDFEADLADCAAAE
jgi:hypothetical protein